MRRTTSTLALGVVGLLGLAGLLGPGAQGSLGCGKAAVLAPLTWEVDVEAGLARAKRENKPAVVYFGASWDTAAKELDYVTFLDPDVRFLLARDFVPIRIDMTDDESENTKKYAERFSIVGDPTIVIYAADGTSELRRVNEFITPATLTAMLHAATRVDAVQKARFEAAVRRRADEARWEEERRKADLSPAQVIVISFPDPPLAAPEPK